MAALTVAGRSRLHRMGMRSQAVTLQLPKTVKRAALSDESTSRVVDFHIVVASMS